MGWKGTLRTVAAVARAAERDAQRRHKQEIKERITNDAASDVANWEQYIEDLISIHTDQRDMINWHDMAEMPPPSAPQQERQHQDKAEFALAAFKPGITDVFKGGSQKIRQRLEKELQEAPKLDYSAYQAAHSTYTDEFSGWKQEASFARRLIAGETAAIKEVLEEMQSLTDQSLIGSSVSFSFSTDFVHGRPEVHTDEIIPKFRRKQLASGKLSETKMPVGRFNELYQDYVASVALKIAGDIFHILPFEVVYVTCFSRMLDPQTGHHTSVPILSVQFVRDTFFNLNLVDLDPSDSMKNFNHVMKFSKTKGFTPIEPIVEDG